jgi:hypothetical protein
MKAARLRLFAAAFLFVGWLSYLAFLALGHSKPIVVSRSQLAVAKYVVKADVKIDAGGKPEATVQVRESFGNNRIKVDTVDVTNLSLARLPGGKPITSAGTYLLPLTADVDLPGLNGAFLPLKVVPTPNRHDSDLKPLYLIYPWNAEVERQMNELVPKAE